MGCGCVCVCVRERERERERECRLVYGVHKGRKRRAVVDFAMFVSDGEVSDTWWLVVCVLYGVWICRMRVCVCSCRSVVCLFTGCTQCVLLSVGEGFRVLNANGDCHIVCVLRTAYTQHTDDVSVLVCERAAIVVRGARSVVNVSFHTGHATPHLVPSVCRVSPVSLCIMQLAAALT